MIETKITPLGDRLLVEPVEQETLTKAGIILPDTAKEKPQKGRIIAKGQGRLGTNGKREAIDAEEGDEILYSRYGGTEITIDNKDLIVLRESDILAKLD